MKFHLIRSRRHYFPQRGNSNGGDSDAIYSDVRIPAAAVYRLFPINRVHTRNSNYDRVCPTLRANFRPLYIHRAFRFRSIYRDMPTANVAADNACYARLAPTTLNLVDLANRMENGVVGRSIVGCCVREASVWHFSESRLSLSITSRRFFTASADRCLNGGDDDGEIARLDNAR